jgi:uncharacterized membrane protein YhaH (DUF805 family)
MDWLWYLFGFEGRINRAKCWLAGLIIIGWMMLLGLLVAGAGKLFGGPNSIHFGVNDIFEIVDPRALRTWHSASPVSLVVHGIGKPLFVWVYVATAIKRLHDRDKSGWWIVGFFVIPGLYIQFADRLGDSYIALAIGIAAIVLTIWGFVELYCLKGTRWTNRFGPNPLPKVQTPPRRARSQWNQQNETEPFPHSAAAPMVRLVMPHRLGPAPDSETH